MKENPSKRQRRDETTSNPTDPQAAVPAHPPSKRPRLDAPTTAAAIAAAEADPPPAIITASSSHPQQRRNPPPPPLPHPYADLLRDITTKYSVATTSIISSSKIEAKVTTMLAHLSRFDIADFSVLPGVAFLYGRAGEVSKLVTVVEVVKRRVEEIHQPWYQYNGVYEMVAPPSRSRGDEAGRGNGEENVVDDTVPDMRRPGASVGQGEEGAAAEEEEDDEFEVMQDTFEAAIRDRPRKDKMVACMSIFLSRVPVPELLADGAFTLQTNAAEIAKWRKEQNINAS